MLSNSQGHCGFNHSCAYIVENSIVSKTMVHETHIYLSFLHRKHIFPKIQLKQESEWTVLNKKLSLVTAGNVTVKFRKIGTVLIL